MNEYSGILIPIVALLIPIVAIISAVEAGLGAGFVSEWAIQKEQRLGTVRVVPVEGQPSIRPMLSLTLSSDHRVIDGARAAAFLDDLANSLFEPQRALLPS